MNKEKLMEIATNFIETSEYNYVNKELALSEDIAGLKIFESPLLGFASPSDAMFELLKTPEAIGNHFMLPEDWLPGCETVISFFLPFTEAIRTSNKEEKVWPSNEWLHGRIEGQAAVIKLCQYLQSALIGEGYESVVPSLDKRFWSVMSPKPSSEGSPNSLDQPSFTSNWSERHVAYVCGLGTFGLSKGLITKKGIAGRFGSIVTMLPLKPDLREYTDIYQNCSMCGACINQCPVNAISIEKGKNHPICSDFLDFTLQKYKPRYGCGKCQVNVPCESCIPEKL